MVKRCWYTGYSKHQGGPHIHLLWIERNKKATFIAVNTFDELEQEALEVLRTMLPPMYTIGPLQHLLEQVDDDGLKSIGSNLWKEDRGCFEWLDTKPPRSVIFVNFGSVTVISSHHLVEFAWGLTNSNQTFVWVVRPDLVSGESAILPMEFVAATEERGLMMEWVPQEEILKHEAVGAFLTHSGWNSTMESLAAGVPVICWPFFAEQQTNCRYCCTEWGIGKEIDSDVKRDEVESLVREFMEGEGGKEMRSRALDWKKKARDASAYPSGSSYLNLKKLLDKLLLASRK
ncbi:hypothetical protein SAY87_020592 [Trapa incisa]|uniref:UDP-glycosyltransferases domain-containing protein n=1 Tax=Trapa incisa TaxID=236973 RepID=A0AAN7JQY2_9MYRT|nr:hypothetical protein SAY87_020592 [Trapa incisa]